jgi:hypothetical protein
MLQEL